MKKPFCPDSGFTETAGWLLYLLLNKNSVSQNLLQRDEKPEEGRGRESLSR